MDSLQIQKIIDHDKESKNIFGGVLAYDELPKKVKWPSCYIINTDIRSKPGTHWLAVYYNKNGMAEFFDSFAMGPEFYKLADYLLKTSKSCIFNTLQIQSLDSDYCGIYAVLFILFRCKKVSFRDFLLNFNLDTFKNDKEIKKLFDMFN